MISSKEGRTYPEGPEINGNYKNYFQYLIALIVYKNHNMSQNQKMAAIAICAGALSEIC